MYLCTHENCGKVIKTQLGFKRHLERHQGIYQYYCPYCRKGLSSTNDIKEHLHKQHTGILGYSCIKCRQEFQTVHVLKDHLDQNDCSIPTETN